MKILKNLLYFVLSDDTAEFNQVNAALISIFKIDAKGKFRFTSELNNAFICLTQDSVRNSLLLFLFGI